MDHGVAANDVGFIGVPFFHIAGIGNLLTGLLMGLPTVIHPLGAFDPGHLLDVLAAEKVTGIFLVPAQWQAVCSAQQANPRDVKLRVISWGAAPASDTLLRQMSETFPGSQILAAFGQTEMSPVTCMLLGEDAIIGWLLQTKALIMIIFANILLDKAIITSETFTALLLMAVASTMLTVPVVAPKLERMKALVTRAA